MGRTALRAFWGAFPWSQSSNLAQIKFSISFLDWMIHFPSTLWKISLNASHTTVGFLFSGALGAVGVLEALGNLPRMEGLLHNYIHPCTQLCAQVHTPDTLHMVLGSLWNSHEVKNPCVKFCCLLRDVNESTGSAERGGWASPRKECRLPEDSWAKNKNYNSDSWALVTCQTLC